MNAVLIRMLVSLSDPVLRERVRRLASEADLHVVDGPRADAAESLHRIAADILLVDREWFGAGRRDRVTGFRFGGTGPEIVYVAVDEDPADRSALLARGCLAVIDGRAGNPEFEQAILRLVGDWRKGAFARMESQRLRQSLQLGDFITASPSMKKLMTTARRVSTSDTSVLILGETGVGKERLAAAIHSESRRKHGPMLVVNCGAIPETLLESHLFGHERGAFTGADRMHRGYFELAHEGTLLLDEIGEVPTHLQVKLLRVLQEHEIMRVGGETAIPVDVRVIAATNRDLHDEMEAKRFRPDLYYRLSVVPLTIPPLRERKEDIPILVQVYLERFREEVGSSVGSVAPDAMEALTAYYWPGNVREVANVMERAVLLCETEDITLDDLPEGITASFVPKEITPLVQEAIVPASQLGSEWFRLPIREARRAWNAAFEKVYIERALREVRGRIGQAATRLGVDERSLYTKMRAHGLRKEDFR